MNKLKYSKKIFDIKNIIIENLENREKPTKKNNNSMDITMPKILNYELLSNSEIAQVNEGDLSAGGIRIKPKNYKLSTKVRTIKNLKRNQTSKKDQIFNSAQQNLNQKKNEDIPKNIKNFIALNMSSVEASFNSKINSLKSDFNSKFEIIVDNMNLSLENLKNELKKGVKEGIKEGIKEGLKESIKEGLKEGLEESTILKNIKKDINDLKTRESGRFSNSNSLEKNEENSNNLNVTFGNTKIFKDINLNNSEEPDKKEESNINLINKKKEDEKKVEKEDKKRDEKPEEEKEQKEKKNENKKEDEKKDKKCEEDKKEEEKAKENKKENEE